MKLIQLNEQKLIEKTPIPAGIISADVEGLMDEGQYQKAFNSVAGTPGGEKENSPQKVIINSYMEDMFPGIELNKIKDFKDYLEKFVIETGFDDNPAIKFLQDFLKTQTMSRKGFITFNNLYAQDDIEDVDFISSDLTKLLKSDIFEQGTENAQKVIQVYNEIANFYRKFNTDVIKELQGEIVPFVKLNIDTEGALDDASKKALAKMVVFKPGGNNQVDSIKNINDRVTRLKTKGTTQQTQASSDNRVTVPLSSTLEPSTEAKFNSLLKDIKSSEVPQLMRLLKNKKLIG
jgi:hypothetical protein